MYKALSFSALLALFITTASCSSNPAKTETEGKTTDSIPATPKPVRHAFVHFETGKVILHQKTLRTEEESFCLYLPKDYDTAKAWPVIYFFDAHARGKLPVTKYKALSEKYQVILIGSDNSQNGLQENAYDQIAKDMMQTGQAVLNIDPTRIITAGFSGGGKVATSVAMKNSDVYSVISSGAGLDMNHLGSSYFNYAGIVGKGDFNYWDMVDIDLQLVKTPLKHKLFTFDGIHEWPDEATMSDAIAFALKPAKTAPVNTDMSTRDQETATRNGYAKEFQSQDAAHWLPIIKSLNDGFKNSKNTNEKWMDRRLLSFINMMTYMKVADLLNNKSLNEVQPFLMDFKASDPKNPDGPYLAADWYALKDDKEGAISSLNEALKLGYDDFAHFSTDEMLASIKYDPRYRKIYDELSK